jgi:hypothetical protein
VGSLTSHNPIGLHGLLRGHLYLTDVGLTRPEHGTQNLLPNSVEVNAAVQFALLKTDPNRPALLIGTTYQYSLRPGTNVSGKGVQKLGASPPLPHNEMINQITN